MKVFQPPELTFLPRPVRGHPDQDPGQKPHACSVMTITAENTYPRHEFLLLETLADYDREVTEYYDLRSGSRPRVFPHLVATHHRRGWHVSPIMEVLHEQGLSSADSPE